MSNAPSPSNLQQQYEAALKRKNECLHGLARSEAIDSGDLAAAFAEITVAASKGLDIERVGVWLYEDDTKDAMSSPDLYLRTTDEHTKAPVLSHTAFPTYFSELAKERVIPAGDAHTHLATAELSEAYLTPLGIGALLDAPIRFGGKMVGLVCHEHVGPARQWNQDEINFAGAMADSVARAMAAHERLNAVEALRESNRTLEDRIRERTAELAQTNDELTQLHRHKNEMFQNVSHELRTPLTLIMAPLEGMLDDENLPEAQKPRLEGMRKNAFRLLGMINDLLDLAKLEATALEFHPVPVDIHTTCARLAAELEPTAADRGVALRFAGPTTDVWASLDPQFLERVLVNLLSNALKFTPIGGTITLGLDDSEHGLTLWVSDTGPGIPKDSQERIFERFEQLDGGTTRNHGGTGLGLALVRELTQLMGGTVQLDSEVGKGSQFSLKFPTASRTQAPGEAGPDFATEGLAALSRRAVYASLALEVDDVESRGDRGPVVVVVEDNPAIRRELVDLLAPEYRVHACRDGREALDLVLRQRPHIVLSDVMMPNVDGLQLAAEIRKRPELRDTALVLLSAKGTVEDRVKGRSLGVDAYLTKPFHPKEVLATLEGLLRSRMRLLGSYMLSERIGSGGQGEVFRGEHVETGEQAAIKVVSGGNDTSGKQQLDVERRALSQLRHPNIVKVLEEGEFEDRYYVVMEHLQGQTVADVVSQRGGLSTAQVADVGFALSDALATVHDAGLVHSDIKAKNVMIIQGPSPVRERVRLIDFGAVYHATHQRSSKIMGTLSYFAPEVLDGGTVSDLSDIYSIGVFTYYALTGKMPFSGSDNRELTKSILENRYTPLAELLTGDVSDIADIVERALARDPAKRYPSGSALRDAFGAVAPKDGAALVVGTSGNLDSATWAFERAS